MVEITKKTSSSSTTDTNKSNNAPIPGLNTATAITLWLLVTSVLPFVIKNFVKNDNDGKNTDLLLLLPNTLGLLVLFFNNLNILIAMCEIALGNHIQVIKRDYLELKKKYQDKTELQYQAAFDYLFMPLSATTLFCGKTWSKMWSTYALWDPSYQNYESFGFFIDVGNGWSTIPPCILWNIAIINPNLLEGTTVTSSSSSSSNAYIWVAFLGCCSYWQMLYGTIIYLFSYIYNQRYAGRPWPEVIGFVAFANGIWFLFPIFALYAAFCMLQQQSLVTVFYNH